MPSTPPDTTLKAGFSRQCITPPLPVTVEGFNLTEPCTCVHDDLYLRALYLEQASRRAVVVALDLLFMDRIEVETIKAALWRRFRLTPDQVLLNFSHTHSGPRISRWSYSGAPSPNYIEFLTRAMIAAIETAMTGAVPVTLHAGVTETALPISRRRIGADGRAVWGPSRSEPVFRCLPFCRFETVSGKLLALLFSASCHPTINHAPVISAEYPGVAVRRLNAVFQTDGCIFLQGAGGDAKPVNIAVGEDHFRASDWADVECAGRIVADDLIRGQARLTGPHPADLRTDVIDVRLPLLPGPTRAMLENRLRDKTSDAMGRAWAADMLDRLTIHGALDDPVDVQMHGLRLGPGIRLVGLEGELTADQGRLISRTSGTGVTFPLGYTNGSRLNIPADRQLPQGGYGVDSIWEFHWPANLAPGIDQIIRDGCRRLWKGA